MSVTRLRRRVLLPFSLACFVCTATVAPAQTTVPSPTQFFGFPMGAEEKLAGWDEIVAYFHTVDRASPRVLVQELGKTTMGKPYIMAIVSTPDTIANLAAYQEMQRKLAKVGMRGGSIPIIDVRGRLLVGFDPRALDAAVKAASGSATL